MNSAVNRRIHAISMVFSTQDCKTAARVFPFCPVACFNSFLTL